MPYYTFILLNNPQTSPTLSRLESIITSLIVLKTFNCRKDIIMKRTVNEIRIDAMNRHYQEMTKLENKLIELEVPEETIDNILDLFDLTLRSHLRYIDALEFIKAVGDLPPSIVGFLYTMISILMLPFLSSPFQRTYKISMLLNMKMMVAVEFWYNKKIVMPILEYRQQIQLIKK